MVIVIGGGGGGIYLSSIVLSLKIPEIGANRIKIVWRAPYNIFNVFRFRKIHHIH